MEHTLRSFIAIPLSADVRRWLADARAALERGLPSGAVRWTAIDGIHITLKFLGEIPAARVDAIRAVMDRAAAGRRAFTVAAEGLGCFPSLRRPRVIWAGVRAQPELDALQKQLEDGLAAAGFPREQRAFAPHLTLARVRDGAAENVLEAIGRSVGTAQIKSAAEMAADEFCLFRSVLKPGGPEYSILFTAALCSVAAEGKA
jgi:RNA 2',3'-cyclic 3'-phosphodiesterase